MTLEEMLTREAIRYTIGRYNSAIDRSAYHELVDVFTPDGVFKIGALAAFEGRDAIIATLSAGAKNRGAHLTENFQRHLLGSPIINVIDAATAKSVTYIFVLGENGPDHSGVYIDDFVKVGERWMIKHRWGCLEWASPSSRFSAFAGLCTAPKAALDLGFASSALG